MNDNKKTPAAVGAATDERDDGKRSHYTYDYTSERRFCQAVLNDIIDCAAAIGETPSDTDLAAYNAGKIAAFASALRFILEAET